MSDLKELIERELESFIEWDGDDKSIVTTTSAKLFAEHVAKIYADHVAGARKMVAAVQGEPVATLIVDEDATSANYRVTGFRVDALSCVPLGEHDLFLAPPVVKESLTAHPVAQATPRPADLPPFATKIIEKLQRFNEGAENGQGPDIGSHWFDILSRLGLLNRVQGSVAWWELSQQGEDVLESFPQPAEQQPDVTQLVEALARCRHEASYSIGEEEALSIQLGKVRDIVNQTLSALAPYRKGGEA